MAIAKPISRRGGLWLRALYMKPAFLWLTFILARALVANGQFGTIRDTDGYTNVRADSSTSAKIIGQLHDGDVFTYTYTYHGWVKVYYQPDEFSNRGYLEGYIYHDRLLAIDDLQPLSENGRTLAGGHLTLHNDSVTVELRMAPFQAKQHVLEKDKRGWIQKIDGKRPVGTDGEMPDQKLISLHMIIRGNLVDIPAAAWNDVYEPDPETCHVFFDTRTGFIYVNILGSDGAGAYEIFWIFKNGRYVKRYVGGF